MSVLRGRHPTSDTQRRFTELPRFPAWQTVANSFVSRPCWTLEISEIIGIGEMKFNNLTFAEMPFGEITFGEVAFCVIWYSAKCWVTAKPTVLGPNLSKPTLP